MSDRPVEPPHASARGDDAGPLERVRLILQAIRFSHTLFALPFAALAAVWAARGVPQPLDVALLLAAMVAARTAAMAFNRVADARLDAENPRTRDRAIPAGRLSRGAVAALAVGSAAVFVLVAAAFWPLRANPWPAALAVPFLAVLLGYSYAKRFTALSHYWLGAALGLSPAGVWIALRGRIDWPPVVLGLAVALWAAGFDIIYSLQDLDHDRRVGLRSLPASLGAESALALARAGHGATIAVLAALMVTSRHGWLDGGALVLGPWYLAGTLAMAALLAWEHALVRPGDLRHVGRAFFTANAAGSVTFATLGVVDALT